MYTQHQQTQYNQVIIKQNQAMMKGGFSKYSRPTTAKKPETQKPKIPTSQQEDISELMEQLIISQKQCERSGKYVEAEGFKRKIKMLKTESGKRDLINIKQRHEKQRKQIQDVHLEELNCFNIEWDQKVAELHNSVNSMQEELALRHQEQIRLVQEQMMAEKPSKFRQSAELLNLRHIQQELARQQNYMEAHQVQVKAQKLQKDQLEKWKKQQTSKCKSNLNLLKQKQQGELKALRQRIDLAYEERNRQKHQQYEKMMLKYQNTMKQLEFHQKQELIKFDKSQKLEQAQKKTKIGTLSSSKMSLY